MRFSRIEDLNDALPGADYQRLSTRRDIGATSPTVALSVLAMRSSAHTGTTGMLRTAATLTSWPAW